MTTVDRTFNRAFFAVLGLTALLWLAGIILLPALGPPYGDEAEAQAQTESVDAQASAVNHNTWSNVPPRQEDGVHDGQICLPQKR